MAITSPFVLDGFEHGVSGAGSTNGGGLWTAQAGTYSITTSNPRGGGTYGQRSLQINPSAATGYIRWSPSNTTRNVVRFGLRFNSLPGANVTFLTFAQNTANDFTMRYNSASSKLEIGAGSFTASTNTVSAGTWYVIDLDLNLTANPNTYDWRIDGVAQSQATQAVAADSCWQITVGTSASATCDIQIDDLVITNTGGDYPIGDSYIVGVSPSGAGTHSFTANDFSQTTDATNWTNISSTSDDQSAKLGQLPMSGTSSRIRQTVLRTSAYLEHTLANLPGSASAVNAARGYVSYMAAGTTANQGAAGAYRASDTTFLAIFGNPTTRGDMSETSAFYKSANLALNGTTTAEVDGLTCRIGYSGDVTPNPHWLSLLLQVDVTVSSGGATVTPAAIAATTALPAAKVSAGAAPAAVAATASAPAPAVRVGAAPAVITAPASFHAPTVITGAGPAPSAVAAVATLPAPAVSTATAPAVIRSTGALPIVPQRVIIPAYFYPAVGFGIQYWDALLAVGAPGIYAVIANPASGPGVSADSNYTSIIADTQAAGIKVFGYVDTSYAARTAADVDNDVDAWFTLYGIRDIFFDQVSSGAGDLTYYTARTGHVYDNLATAEVILNPGTNPDEGYVSIADIICNFEGTPATYEAFTFSAYVTSYPPRKFLHLVYDAPTSTDMAAVVTRAKSENAGYVYVTDDTAAVTQWDTTASYLDAEVPEVLRRLAVSVGAAPAAAAAVAAAPAPAVSVGAAPAAAAAALVALPAPDSVGQGAAGATATPAQISTAAALPAPLVGVGAAPATVAAPVTMAAPTATTGAAATPAAIDAIVTGLQPAVAVGAAPATITAPAALPPATAAAGTVTAPATAQLTATTPAPVASVGAALATVAATVTVPAPTPVAGAATTPATIPATITAPAPAVSIGAAPATVATVATVPTPSAGSSTTITPATITAPATIPAPAVAVGVAPAPTAAVATLPAPGVSVGAAPAPAAAVAAIPAPAVAVGAGPASAAALAALPAPAVAVGAAPATLAALVAITAPAVAVGAAPAPAAALVAITAPTALAGAITAPATVEALATLPAPAVSTAAGPAVITVTTTLPAIISAGEQSGDDNAITPTYTDTGHTLLYRDTGHTARILDDGHTLLYRDTGHTARILDDGHTATVRER